MNEELSIDVTWADLMRRQQVREMCHIALWLLTMGVMALFSPAWAQKPEATRPRSGQGVLVLVSTGYGQAGIDSYVKGLYGTLRDRGVSFTNIHIEYLDLVKNTDGLYRQQLAALLAKKYQTRQIDVVVTLQPAALSFLLNEGRHLAPVARLLVAQGRLPEGVDVERRHFYFQTPTLDFGGTLQRALELFPKTRRVMFLNGNSAVELQRQADAVEQFKPWENKLEFEYLDKLGLDEIERKLSNLPPNTVIIAPGVNRDGNGLVHVPVETIIRIARTASAPVFPVYAVSVGQGPVGGMVSVLEDEGRAMGLSVAELQQRAVADRQGFIVRKAKPVSMFDWRQIERWGGEWRKLPADTIFLNRPPSLWREYRGYVLGGIVTIVLLSVLVVALALQNRRRLRAERSLLASQSRYQLLADNMSDVLWIMNLENRRWEYVSPSALGLFDYSADELMRRPVETIMTPEGSVEFQQRVAKRLEDFRTQPEGSRTYTDVMALRRRDGSLIWVESATHYLRNEQGELVLMGVSRDVSQRMAAEQEIKQLAFFDSLTQLPNRKLLQDRAQHAMVNGSRNHRSGALLFIDLDHFKYLNDAKGHEVGDQLLCQVAQRLQGCVRAGDTVARLGGDEFVILLEELSENIEQAASEARVVAEKILEALRPIYHLVSADYHITASLGVAMFQGLEHSLDELLKRADLAMYQAKASGRDSLRFFDPQMQAWVTSRTAMEADLRQAVTDGQFLLHFQPQVDAERRIVGAEALVRWMHPARGLVSPAEFIPLAEDTGLILPLGNWVLEAACRQLLAWDTHPMSSTLTLAVNVSPRQFRRADFVAQVQAVLERTGASPKRLKLELTESMLLDDVEDAIVKMMDLRKMGITFSLDDFGTGYSSLNYLKRLPLDQLKIDQSFVRDVLTDSNDAAIARTILALGKSLGLAVMAEGVETEGQREFLRGEGCQGYQGYLFSRPLPADEFERLLEEPQT